jgi:hypothetical protein
MNLTERQELIMRAAQRGYESYCKYTGGKSAVTGDLLPLWDDLPGNIVNAWFAAANGIVDFMAANRG